MTDTQEQLQYIPIDRIIVRQQIRSAIDVNSESNKALQASISLYGVQQPIRVMKNEEDPNTYILICGERRLLAARAAGLATIPAIVMDPIGQKVEIKAFQLTENMQREELNPLDLAETIQDYLHLTHADLNQELRGALGVLETVDTAPDHLSSQVILTVRKLSQITGNSIQKLYRALSILKLGNEIREAVRAKTISISHAYVLAANVDSPAFKRACDLAMSGDTTIAALQKLFASAKPAATQKKPPAANFTRQCQTLQNWRTVIDKDAAKYGQEELQRLLDELKGLVEVVEGKVGLLD